MGLTTDWKSCRFSSTCGINVQKELVGDDRTLVGIRLGFGPSVV